MSIGRKILELRQKFGLTQEELADRAELSKGFISQLERDLTSPSIATLMDILECLGTNLQEFFTETPAEKAVFGPQDCFEKVDAQAGTTLTWLIPHAQKNRMEPILFTLAPGCQSEMDDPHEGEEFGHVLAGSVILNLGTRHHRVKKGESFCFTPSVPHGLKNPGKSEARILWVATPPSF